MTEPHAIDPHIDAYLKLADMLTTLDEPERALKLLEQLPGFYRDNVPAPILDMRAKILHSLITPNGYAAVDFDSHVKPGPESLALAKNLLRGQIALELIQKLNDASQVPHIVDMGPGEYWLPIALTELERAFTYDDVSLLKRTGEQARKYIATSAFDEPGNAAPRVFVAFELIEHMPEPMDLAVEAIQHCGRWPEYVLLSTPLYCYDGRRDWAKLYGQAHLRTYTPQEFFEAARRVFPGYNWEFKSDKIMVLKGEKNGSRT